ncbi:hypothetical protein HPS36_02055 [Halorubrum salinarum]|uniref:Uncharacterized protein n=1 Tax=Halorubrum salinarum TaxID=2739057 RepID=A0A7D3YKM0_9EURY|nr:hypothetical protein [Halorubrum salinarum]QKG91686.1 hypothetical protein HPS36_02055 [Halorubrum salinarum]
MATTAVEQTETTAVTAVEQAETTAATASVEGHKAAEQAIEGTRVERLDQMMSGMINEIVGGIFAIALGLVLLNQLFSIGIIETENGSYTGPFGNVFGTIESVGGAALTFAVLGMLALAGGTAVRMFRT